MNGVLGFFGRAFRVLSGILAVLILAAGFYYGGTVWGGHRGFNFGFAVLGLVIAFIWDTFIFGFIGIIAEISDKLDWLRSDIESLKDGMRKD